MGSFTLSTILSEGTSLIGNRTDLTQSRASLYANRALGFIWDTVEHDKSEAIAVSSTTSSENRVTLPSDFQELTALSNTSAVPPTVLTKWNIEDIDSGSTTGGTPTNYVQYNDWLELWPVPDSQYSLQLRYKTKPSILTALTATSSFATRYDMAWLYKSSELFADALKDWETAGVMRQRFISEMASVPSDLALRQRAREGMALRIPRHPRGQVRSDRSDCW